MAFFVDPGKRAYVHRINFKGNTKTRDEVLRREMRQMESSWASSSKIERSKTRLERLGYFESVNVETPPVVGTSDQIDVDYTVVEKPSGNLSAGIGFSQVQGIVLNANISQDNVFGSGKRVNLAFNNSDYATNYQFGFFNPYFTPDGVSLGYNLGYSKRDAGQINIANDSTDDANEVMDYGIPLNEFDQLRFGSDLRHTKLKASSATSTQITDFVNEQGSSFLTLAPNVSWTHDTLNRAIFPSKGGQQRFSALATAPGVSDLEYYKLSYKHQVYFPLAKDLTFRLHGEIAYGDGYGDTKNLPFFENYFGGGTGSIRGFKNNTVGPTDSRGFSFGGSNKIIGNAELFFPVPFLSETKSVRLGTFFDAGRIANSFGLSDLKYSAGISGEWLSPFGALSVSAALPLNAESGSGTVDDPGDQEQIFQFNFGQNF
jgi:outer membrane protein insertion porin family